MSLGAAVALAAIILGGMFALIFVLAAVEERLLASVLVDPLAEVETEITVLETVEVETLPRVA